MTSPETNQGAPSNSVASTTLPAASAARTAPEETGRPSSSSGGTISTANAEPRALLGQKTRRAHAVLAEMKIEADRRAADAERARKNCDDEIFGGGRRQRRVEIHDDGAVEPGRRQQAQLVRSSTELEQRILRAAGSAADAARRSAPPPFVRVRARASAPLPMTAR